MDGGDRMTKSIQIFENEFSEISFKPLFNDIGVFRIYKPQAVGSNIPNHVPFEEGFSTVSAFNNLKNEVISPVEFKRTLATKIKGEWIPGIALAREDSLALGQEVVFEEFPFWCLIEEQTHNTASIVTLDFESQLIFRGLSGTVVPREINLTLTIPPGFSWMSSRIDLERESFLSVNESLKKDQNGLELFEVTVALPADKYQEALSHILDNIGSDAVRPEHWAKALNDLKLVTTPLCVASH